MKKLKTNQKVLKIFKKHKKVGKLFILFVFVCAFTSVILLSNVFSNLLYVGEIKLFNGGNVASQTLDLFCVCFGSFDSENLASTQSQLIRNKGGAGFVFKNDNTYSILLSAYLDEQTCKSVIEKNKDNLNNLTQLKICVDNGKLEFNKSVKNLQPLKDIYSLPLSTFKKLAEISNKFDSGEYLSSKAYNELFSLTYEINNKIDKFKNSSNLTDEKTYSKLLKNAQNIYGKVNSLILNKEKSQLSQNLKYCYLDVILINI